MAPTAHVPAWKRLGLTLKHAKESPAAVVESVQSGADGKKRKPGTVEDQDVHSGDVVVRKKAKTSKGPKPKSSSTLPTSEKLQHTQPPSSSEKRKSVSFSADTKIADGESVKQLYHAWLGQQDDDFDPATASEALRSLSPPPAHPADTTAPPTAIKKARGAKKGERAESAKRAKEQKEPKEPKKPKKAKLPKPQAPETAQQSLVLDYLTAYHTSHATWKFNKNRQTTILKHVFDPTFIPHAHDPALQAYMSGLNSAPARARLLVSALQIRADNEADLSAATDADLEPTKTLDVADIEPGTEKAKRGRKRKASSENRDADSPAVASANRQKEYYRYALARYKKSVKMKLLEQEEEQLRLSPEWIYRMRRRQRAELILSTLGEEEPEGAVGAVDAVGAAGDSGAGAAPSLADPPVPKTEFVFEPGPVVNGVKGKRIRLRKRRTGVPDDDSSSDESSEDSSGERAVADDDELAKPLAAIKAAANATAGSAPSGEGSDGSDGSSDSQSIDSSDDSDGGSSSSGESHASDEA
jgi:hypothetical protein